MHLLPISAPTPNIPANLRHTESCLLFLKSLSGRFLFLTIIFVMLAEVLIFVPSVARFRLNYLQERVELAQLASLSLIDSPTI